jgi:hypothetical protein
LPIVPHQGRGSRAILLALKLSSFVFRPSTGADSKLRAPLCALPGALTGKTLDSSYVATPLGFESRRGILEVLLEV